MREAAAQPSEAALGGTGLSGSWRHSGTERSLIVLLIFPSLMDCSPGALQVGPLPHTAEVPGTHIKRCIQSRGGARLCGR